MFLWKILFMKNIIYKKYYLWKILNIIKINNIKSWVIFIIFFLISFMFIILKSVFKIKKFCWEIANDGTMQRDAQISFKKVNDAWVSPPPPPPPPPHHHHSYQKQAIRELSFSHRVQIVGRNSTGYRRLAD